MVSQRTCHLKLVIKMATKKIKSVMIRKRVMKREMLVMVMITVISWKINNRKKMKTAMKNLVLEVKVEVVAGVKVKMAITWMKRLGLRTYCNKDLAL